MEITKANKETVEQAGKCNLALPLSLCLFAPVSLSLSHPSPSLPHLSNRTLCSMQANVAVNT